MRFVLHGSVWRHYDTMTRLRGQTIFRFAAHLRGSVIAMSIVNTTNDDASVAILELFPRQG